MTEVAYISDLIHDELDIYDLDQKEEKILLCGSWCEVAPCLEYISSHFPSPSIFPHIVVATDEIERFLSVYMFKDQIELVDWNEHDYEEVLIERVKNKHDRKRHIRLVVDFQPTPRRLQRIRQLLEKDGILIIPYEKPAWRARYALLMRSFTNDGGALIKLSETMATAHATRQRQNALAEGYRMGIKWTSTVADACRER
ncbi:hypothetical protein FGIG_05201 [Fasciola gigantica]|uniref:Uncharacterized protein n=1 Tax=Fasciola gigantica TaxID=46835 RepID=A0A504YYI9_FASGI|nr:hypothetical protein FGIG_05201 [Fasciola gigantica]